METPPFYNTTNLSGPELDTARRKAINQNDRGNADLQG